MVICPACGARVQHGREDVHWRQQVRDTVERHKEKKRREQARHDDDARQLSIFPEASEQDEEDRAVRARRAEIRARVEDKLSKRPTSRGNKARVSSSSSRGGTSVGDVQLGGGRGAVAAAALSRSAPEREAELAEQEFDPTTCEFDRDDFEPGADLEIAGNVPIPDVADAASEPFIGFGLASPGERVLSGFIDLAFVSLIQLTLFYLTTHLVAQRLGALPASAVVAMGLVGAVLAAGYFLFFWSLSGQTLGKLLTGGRVVNAGGEGALGISRAAIRLVGACLSLLPLGAGFMGLWTDTERRGWHDRMAGTKVVRG
jgi:uncharacterized RDD family membrane protein YckC